MPDKEKWTLYAARDGYIVWRRAVTLVSEVPGYGTFLVPAFEFAWRRAIEFRGAA